MLRISVLLLAATWTLGAGAVTYKWVDERGVVNYSNSPPAAATAGRKLARVEDRVSTYESDPALLRAAAARAAMPRPDYAEVEWLQRQRLMAERQAAQQAYAGAESVPPGYYPYFLPVGFVHRRSTVRPTFFVSQQSFARPRGSMMFR